MTPLEKFRTEYQPALPQVLLNLLSLKKEEGERTAAAKDVEEVQKLFPSLFGQAVCSFSEGETQEGRLLRVGVLFSGGQASGGHNVITGLFDALKKIHRESRLFGFLGGPSGIIDGQSIELVEDELLRYRNQGGFDMIGSGRTKIETDEQFAKAMQVCRNLQLDGLVVIGGDDSNTNAAMLAEYFLQNDCRTCVMGVPKTIDGDLKNKYVQTSFGFDTAVKVYSEMIGNICRDALSAKKYYHFVKLMGRSASHVTLECALETHANFTILGEEVLEKKLSLKALVDILTDVIVNRAKDGKQYGVVLLPEGLVEFIPEMKRLIEEISDILAEGSPDQVKEKLSPEMKEAYLFLPEKVQEQLLLDRDPHGNVQLSHVSTESLLVEGVKKALKARGAEFVKFTPVTHFLGYEGRAGLPSNFDANYCYALGQVAALGIFHGITGHMAVVRGLTEETSKWEVMTLPITSLMNLEVRKGKQKAVIAKALVDLRGRPFEHFVQNRNSWGLEDHYVFPGPIQFSGPEEITNRLTETLLLEGVTGN